MLTGWATAEHAQALKISTKVHATFCHTLLLAGLARLIEICFIPPPPPTTIVEEGQGQEDGSEHTLTAESPGGTIPSSLEVVGREGRGRGRVLGKPSDIFLHS